MAVRVATGESSHAFGISFEQQSRARRCVHASSGHAERRGFDHPGTGSLDGTKIKADAGGNTFRRREKIAAHLEAVPEQVRVLNEQAEKEERSRWRSTRP
jgi:hypothetical protein